MGGWLLSNTFFVKSYLRKINGYSMVGRVVVSVSTSRSRDGVETYFSNVSVSSRSRQSMGRSRSRLGLKAKRLSLVSVSGHNVSFTSGHLNNFFSFFHFHDVCMEFNRFLDSSSVGLRLFNDWWFVCNSATACFAPCMQLGSQWESSASQAL